MLRPEVAALFELTGHVTRLHVPRLGRDIDLKQISVEEAEQLVALEGGFEWLRRKNEAGLPVTAGRPARTKRKKGA